MENINFKTDSITATGMDIQPTQFNQVRESSR
jgi:hypothetical protein